MKEDKLKILIVTQYFWPENMRINDLVEGLLERGHKVTVLTGLPNYPEGQLYPEFRNNKKDFSDYKGADIIRVPIFPRGNKKLRLILNYLSFFSSGSTIGLFKLRKQSFDTIFVYGASPIMSAIPAIIIGRVKASPVFLWVLDLWPESLSAVGAVHNKTILQAVGRVVSWIYNRTDYILVQSKSFKSNILEYCTSFIEDDRIIYFPSWVEEVLLSKSYTSDCMLLKKEEQIFTVLFAGNVGEAQDFPSIIKAFEKIKEVSSIRLVVVGDGRMLSWVKEQIKVRQLTNVVLLGRHPLDKMAGLFNSSDALLVSLKQDDVFSKTIPAKLQAYLASGKPVLGMIDGEAGDIISESRCGLVGPSGDSDTLVRNINKLSMLTLEEREKMGQNGIEFYKQHFQSSSLFSKLEVLFKSATLRKKNSSKLG